MAAFVTAPVRVRVPATSANLGPGFDALGLALGLRDVVTARVTPGGIGVTVTGEGAGELPTDDSHLVVRCMLATFERLGVPAPGLDVHCANGIPQARGLGSSSAAIVAGILAARGLVEDGVERLPQPAVLELANEIEGHPDNVAPCLLGGFTIAWLEDGKAEHDTARGDTARDDTARDDTARGDTARGDTARDGRAEADTGHGTGRARAVRLEPAVGVHPVVFIPEERGLTAHARAALPPTVPHADAARTAGRAALLVHALTAAPDLLFPATEDRLHQQYRAPGMPGTAALVDTLRTAGIPAVVSGAGPTVLAFGVPTEMPVTPGWRVCAPGLDLTGAQVG